MRLLRLCTNNPGYLQGFYERHRELAAHPYATQHGLLMEDCYGWADFWTHGLDPLGYAVWEPVGNAETQQKQWAREQGVEYDESRWLHDISLAQLESFAPDVVLVNDHHTFGRAFFEEARRRCPSVRLVLGWCGAPFGDMDVFSAYDLTLSNVPWVHDVLRRKGHPVRLFRHGFSPVVLRRMRQPAPPAPSSNGLAFIGSMIDHADYHMSRLKLLTGIAARMPLTIMTPNRVGGVAALSSADQRAPVFGLAMYRALAASGVALNTHIDISLGHANNMRLFEATGVGACLLTDHADNLAELFAVDTEIATYRTPEEAVEKARYLLEHPAEREAMAKAGQRRTLAAHSFDQRALELDALIRHMLR